MARMMTHSVDPQWHKALKVEANRNGDIARVSQGTHFYS